jgi:polysaccharide chain length determinant protein (PEP-CTERM system associated)
MDGVMNRMAVSRLGDSTFEHILNILRRRKWAGLITFAAVLSLAAPFAVFLPDIYRASATVIVESQDAPSTFVKPSVPELETRLVTIQQELLSRTRLSDLIIRFNLYSRLRAAHASMDAIVERMRRDIHVDFTGTDQNRGRVTTIGVKLTYVGLDPKSAAEVPNTLASQYVIENTKMRERQTGQMAQFLKSQLDTSGQELQRKEDSLNSFKNVRSGELPDQVSINLVTMEQLNSQLRINTENQLKLRERHDQLVEQSSKSPESHDELATLKQRLSDLQAKFTDQHPDVIQTKAQISELESKRTKDGSGETKHAPRMTETIHSTEGELATLQREEQMLRAQIATYGQRIQAAPKHEQELETLEGDYKSAKASYDSLQTRYEEAQLADSLEQTKKGESFRILDSAAIPTLPAAPNRIRLLFMAFMLAVVSGVGVMLLTEHLDTSFHSVGELRQFTSLPVLVSIPYLKVRADLARRALRFAVSVCIVIAACALLSALAYHAARENTQLVWMLAGSQL